MTQAEGGTGAGTRMNESMQHAAQLLAQAQHAVALTGAGLSTPSGIPDFRSHDTGLWENFDPMEVATFRAFCRRPTDFFNWIRPLARQMFEAEPNLAHYALAELQRAGRVQHIITQNIDGLHQRAGRSMLSNCMATFHRNLRGLLPVYRSTEFRDQL
jgi:NAD-dependent deacetylase